jgi:hypothetical protein
MKMNKLTNEYHNMVLCHDGSGRDFVFRSYLTNGNFPMRRHLLGMIIIPQDVVMLMHKTRTADVFMIQHSLMLANLKQNLSL